MKNDRGVVIYQIFFKQLLYQVCDLRSKKETDFLFQIRIKVKAKYFDSVEASLITSVFQYTN